MIIRIKKSSLVLYLLLIFVSAPVVYAAASTVFVAFKVELVISNRNPAIAISNVTTTLGNSQFSVDLTSAGTTKVLISFNVTDADGSGNINASSAAVNFTLGGTQYYSNISAQSGASFGNCINTSISSTVVMMNCSVVLPYYANASANWFINISIKDLNGGSAVNDSAKFTINTVSGLALPAAFVNFTNVNLGQLNVPSSPLILNNTGNDDFDQINITAAALVGTTITTETIAATSFTANITNATAGSGVPLATTPITLRELTQVGTLDNATIVHGHTDAFAPNRDKGNRTLFFWVNVPSSGLSSQLYNATWNVTVVNLP